VYYFLIQLQTNFHEQCKYMHTYDYLINTNLVFIQLLPMNLLYLAVFNTK